MRKTLIGAAALLGMAVATPGFAQTMTPEQDLQAARQAVQQHHANQAVAAVDRAESAMLDSETAPSRGDTTNDSPVIREMARAREAITQHHWKQADTYLADSMHHSSTSSTDSGTAGVKQQ